MPPQAVSLALEFLYTGKINKRAGMHLASLEQVFTIFLLNFYFVILSKVAKLLELPILDEYLSNLRNKEDFLNSDLTTQVK